MSEGDSEIQRSLSPKVTETQSDKHRRVLHACGMVEMYRSAFLGHGKVSKRVRCRSPRDNRRRAHSSAQDEK